MGDKSPTPTPLPPANANINRTLLLTASPHNKDTYMAVSGGAACLRNEILNTVRKGICPMINDFLAQVKLIEKHKRVLKVTSKETSEDKAARVAKTLASEKPAPRPVLKGMVTEVSTNTCQALFQSRDANQAKNDKESEIEKLSRKLQSLESKIANNSSSASKKANAATKQRELSLPRNPTRDPP